MIFGGAEKRRKRDAVTFLSGLVVGRLKRHPFTSPNNIPSAETLVDAVWSTGPINVMGRKHAPPRALTVALEAACFGAANPSINSEGREALLCVAIDLVRYIKMRPADEFTSIENEILHISVQHLSFTDAYKALEAKAAPPPMR